MLQQQLTASSFSGLLVICSAVRGTAMHRRPTDLLGSIRTYSSTGRWNALVLFPRQPMIDIVFVDLLQ